MAPYFKPLEPASTLTFERYYLAADFISGIGYGAAHQQFMLAYITTLFLISTVVQVDLAHHTQLAFIEHRDFPGGPWAYYEASYSETSTMVSMIASMILILLSEMFMVWRWVRTTAWVISWYTLMLSTNVLSTGLILARLIIHRRAVRTTLATPHAGEHSSLISMLIESAALYSIVGVGYLIAMGVGSPLREPFLGAMLSMQQISGYLIIACLAHGRGWQKSTMSVPSKIVILGNVSTGDAWEGSGEGMSGALKAASGAAE
ncbi:hypothetical protein BD779DRAFT_1518723 [Infundibulicybe gibba]|nr:hypothetical protein BD779DRAFT_1518723 [Infundibulicybe gibba]